MPRRDDEWDEAKRRCPLSDEGIHMAKQLALSPRSLIKNIPNKQQSWKASVEEWVRELHAERFGDRPSKSPAQRSGPERKASDAPEPAPDAPNELELAREELFRKRERGELDGETFGIEDEAIESETPVSDGEVNDENRFLRKRYECFRQFADLFATVAGQLDFVQRIVLFGSVAAPLKKEVPRFRRLRRARIAVWHECKDVDVAVWVTGLTRLRELKRAVSDTTNLWQARAHQNNLPGIPHHAVDVFIMEPGSNRYRGNLCHFGQCPKDKPDCEVAGCGAQPFLRLYEDFKFDRFALFGEHVVVLFDRAAAKPAPNDEAIPF